ncbi:MULTISPECIES: hypothetical protein [Betaproteobacteria]|jgi:hypothetical protein|uniref:Toxin-antitoxin system HicB family antitoxin n=1 Tax=Acidovorax facilis TaxID=12917 RepID=A0ABV8DBT7_9BURK|nr:MULTISPECIES: hypothetical protein [Acidovorax]KQB60504.1 hypothetical protein AE621_04700 [Acidovorax sp. SD340]MBO1009711.1 hypothetical protein [Acidovorax sp. SD340]MCO4243565.1 hypothetical protein [Acidovorax facilis]
MASPGKKSFPLRIDPALWSQIERLAAHELRSANAQVEVLLREALERRGISPASARKLPGAQESAASPDEEPSP